MGIYILIIIFFSAPWHFILGKAVMIDKLNGMKMQLLIIPFCWSFVGMGFYLTIYDDIKVLTNYDSMKTGNLSIIDFGGSKGKTSYYEGLLLEKNVKRRIQASNLFGTEIDFTSYDSDIYPRIPIDTIPVYYSEKHEILIAKNKTTSQKGYLDDRISQCILGILICNSLFYWVLHNKIWNSR